MNDVGNQESVIKNAMEEQDVGSSQVLGAIAEINSITARVRDGSSSILEGSRIVVGEMERLSDITRQMGDGMDEIVSGTNGINEAIQNVNQIAQNTSGSITRVSEEASRFTV
jgi:methyl-accepting chemotaxis protein